MADSVQWLSQSDYNICISLREVVKDHECVRHRHFHIYTLNDLTS